MTAPPPSPSSCYKQGYCVSGGPKHLLLLDYSCYFESLNIKKSNVTNVTILVWS